MFFQNCQSFGHSKGRTFLARISEDWSRSKLNNGLNLIYGKAYLELGHCKGFLTSGLQFLHFLFSMHDAK